MADFGWVHRSFHDDLAMREATEDARDLALYLLTCPDRATEGFYRLRLATICAHRRREPAQIREALAELERLDFARYDERAEIVLIVKALKYQRPSNDTQLRGAVKAVDAVHDAPELFNGLLASADRYAPKFSARLRAQYGLKA